MRRNATRIIYALAVCASWTQATTVEPMPLARLADHAAAVCDGVVESVQSRWSEQPREIITEIRLANVSYWKGSLPTAAAPGGLSLIVPGGTVGSMTMRIAGAPEFALGQHWVLFVLPEYRTFPTVGVSQGAFRVIRDADGVARIADVQGRPIAGLDGKGFVRTVEPSASAATCVHADRVRLIEAPAAASVPGLSLAQFRELVRPILSASRVHGTTTPGRRTPTRLIATPLIRAPATQQDPNPASRALPSALKATTVKPEVRRSQDMVQPGK